MWFLYYALADTPAAAKRAGQNFKPEVILQTSTQNFQNSANYCAFEGVVANYFAGADENSPFKFSEFNQPDSETSFAQDLAAQKLYHERVLDYNHSTSRLPLWPTRYYDDDGHEVRTPCLPGQHELQGHYQHDNEYDPYCACTQLSLSRQTAHTFCNDS